MLAINKTIINLPSIFIGKISWMSSLLLRRIFKKERTKILTIYHVHLKKLFDKMETGCIVGDDPFFKQDNW